MMTSIAEYRIGSNSYLENMWWATFAHLVVLALAFTAAEYARPIANTLYLPTAEDESSPLRSGEILSDSSVVMARRVRRVAEHSIVGFLMLFSATTITEFGYSGTLTTAILAWSFVLLMLAQIITILSTDKPGTVVPFQVVTNVLIIVLFALAFRGIKYPPGHGGRHIHLL